MNWQEQLAQDLKRDEGYRDTLYKCPAGRWTIGYGWCIEDRPIRKDEAELRLKNDMAEVILDAGFVFPWFEFLSDNRKRGVCNLIFNLGMTRTLGFKRALQAMAEGRWNAAADEILDSRYARQVGARANRVAELIRNG